MSAGAGLGRLAVLLSERDFAVHHGVLFVLAIGVMGIWAPTVLVFDVELLVGGLFAGFVLGSPVEGFLGGMLGGSAMALFWLVVLAGAGQVGLAFVTALLAFGNATVGGVVGGLVGSFAQ